MLLYSLPDINIVFAITKKAVPIYKKLAEFIGQPNNVGVLSDRDGLERLIKENLQTIASMYILISIVF